MIIGMASDSQEADDIVQEAFTRAFLNLKKFKFKSEFKTWLISIAINLARNHLRKRRHFIEFDEKKVEDIRDYHGDGHEDQPSEEILAAFLKDLDREAAKLPEMQRMVFLLRIQQEKSIKETAVFLTITEGTVKSHLNRVVTRFRKKFGDRYKTVFGEQ